jgi:hypothetical protein
MDAAQIIRDAVTRVSQLRDIHVSDPELSARVTAVKAFQSHRFAGTYADLLGGGPYRDAARFFLEELYSDKDYADRDAQFGRIAGALQTLFPKQVVATAVSLAQLHILTEEMDHAMALSWPSAGALADMSPSAWYISAWRAVGRRAERNRQLQVVQEIGRELARLTRMPGLRLMLRMMRKPAHAAGLGSLQEFLESGFDTFAGMSRRPNGVETFLSIVDERESALIDLLFDGEPVACETKLAAILGRSHRPAAASTGKMT